MDLPHLKSLAGKLESSATKLRGQSVVTGFDGFVDEMITVVDERADENSYTRVPTISRFSELVKAASGMSSLREIVVTKTDPGGCAINMGDGLASLGLAVTTFATAGEPVHAAFSEYSNKAALHSWGREPGRTLAYEFSDGKLMHSSVSHLAEFTPDYIRKRLQEGVFQASCEKAQLIALTDWTLYPHMTECWRFLQESVFNQLPRRIPFFIDLVDPSNRSETDIREMLKVLPGFESCGPCTLGLNQNEANILSKLLHLEFADQPGIKAAAKQARELRQALGITEVLIHSLRYAVLATPDGESEAEGPYCEDPVKSTGAGDRFNAGYAAGLLLELEPPLRIRLACASSGLYVRKGSSPTMEELIEFVRNWASDNV
ncbi:MAG: PfkB family carbohydrate kinase [Puniceicoccaceae bacterium]